MTGQEQYSTSKIPPGFLFAACCGFYIVLALVADIFFSSRFETNDDAAMMSMAAGVMGVEPSEYLYMTHILLGKVLVWMFQFGGMETNWYVVYLNAVYILALAWISFHAVRHRFWVLLVPLVFYFGLRCFILPQVTTAAALIGIAGLFPVFLNRDRSFNRVETAVAVGFLVLCFMMRREVFVLLMAVVMPVWFALGSKYWLKGVWVIGPALLLSVVLFAYEKSAVEAEWKEFYDSVTSLHVGSDTPRKAHFKWKGNRYEPIYSEGVSRAYEELGWEKEELRLLQRWVILDYKVFPPEKFSVVKESLPFITTINAVERIEEWFTRYSHAAIFFLFLPLIGMMLLERKQSMVFLLTWVATVYLIFFLAFFWRMPFRVLFSMCLFLYVIMMSLADRGSAKSESKTWVLSGAIAVFIAFGLSAFADIGRKNQAEYQMAEVVFDGIGQYDENQDKVFMLATVLPTQYFYRSEIAASVKNTRMLRPGWGYWHPGNHAHLEYLSEENPVEALWQHEKAFLVSTDYMIRFLRPFISKHYGIEVEFLKLVDFKEQTQEFEAVSKVGIYKLKIKEEENEAD